MAETRYSDTVNSREEKVSCIIPAFNEADRIEETIRSIRSIPAVSELLVIDDGSDDNTASRAREVGARVLHLRKTQGKGFCLEKGLSRTSEKWVLFLDADIGSGAVRMEKIILSAQARDLDMAIASPPLRTAGLGVVQKLSLFVLRSCTGKTLRTPLSGQRVIKREVATMLLPFPHGFGVETAMNIKAMRIGMRVEEIPVVLSHRHTGKDFSGFLHRGRQAREILMVFLQHCLFS